nr:MAG: hypothetical protein [Sanya bunya-like virus 4]
MFRISQLDDLPEKVQYPYLHSRYYKFSVPVKIQAVDLGGTGDCFLRCFNMGLAADRNEVPSMEYYYSLLGQKMNSFLEEDSITSLAIHFGYNLLIYRVGSRTSDLIVFTDTGSAKTLSFVNFFPYHFLFIERFNANGVNYEQFQMSTMSSMLCSLDHNGFPAEINTFYKDYQELILTGEQLLETVQTPSDEELDEVEEMLEPEYSDEEDEYLPQTKVGLSILHPDSTTAQVYAYLVDSVEMVIDSPGRAVDIFYTTHNIFLDRLLSLNRSNLIPPPDLLKAYSKFRHNIFSALCIMALNGMRPCKLETDVSLEKWIDSKKDTRFCF